MTKPSQETILALMAKDVKDIKVDIADIKESLKNDYVTQIEFKPVKNVVIGAIVTIVAYFLNQLLGIFKMHL